jgi:predicted Fe-Mo cluster-binding NifX family protein
MKIVIPYFQGRISPVFDVASHFFLIEVKDGKEFSRKKFDFVGNEIFTKAQILFKMGVDVLICGAISKLQENILRNNGIKLLTFICGDVEEVLEAFIQKRLATGAFQMPGCCKRRKQHCRHRGGWENY